MSALSSQVNSGNQEHEAQPAAAAPPLEVQWAARIRPHLQAGVAGNIAAGIELIQAKRELKKQRGASFIRLVAGELGWSIDAAEKWIAIARNSYLADSANLRNLPTAWTTLYVLCPLKPDILQELVEAGQLHPALTGAEAQTLVRLVRASNSRGRKHDGTHDDDQHADDDNHSDAHGDFPGDAQRADHDADHGGGQSGKHEHRDPAASKAESPAQSITRGDIGPDSRGETERKLARLEQLEHETRRQGIQLAGYESEVSELKAKLAPEIPVRAQQRVFQRAVRTLSKSDAPDLPEKEKRFLRQSATTDLVELVRSAIRDGLKPERFDLVYRPELH